MRLAHERRAVLGDSYEDFNGLRGDHLRYYGTNTVVALSMMVLCGLAYGIATNTFLLAFIDAL